MLIVPDGFVFLLGASRAVHFSVVSEYAYRRQLSLACRHENVAMSVFRSFYHCVLGMYVGGKVFLLVPLICAEER